MASRWRQRRPKGASPTHCSTASSLPLLQESAFVSKTRLFFSRRRSIVQTQALDHAQSHHVELEVEAHAEENDREKRRNHLASMLRHRRSSSRRPRSSTDVTSPASTLVQREKGFRLVRHGSDPLLNDAFYATQVQVGNFVKMGWLTKQGHMWKNWKTRFFILFTDGTFAYYKNRGQRKIKGCMQLNDGVVSVQYVDIRVAGKAYAFQIVKGFYNLLCYCTTQFEAELWVAALRSVRRVSPPCFEMDLTANEEKAGSNAVTRHLNKIFITDKEIATSLAQFKDHDHDHSYAAIHNFMVKLDNAIIDRHYMELYEDPEIELLPGNELVRLIRRFVEDRVFISLYAEAYASLQTDQVRASRHLVEKNLKVLKLKSQSDFGISKDLSVCNWKEAINLIDLLECVSLPTHKFEVVLSAGKVITQLIAEYNGELFEVSDKTLTAIFRFVITMSSLKDLPILRALMKYGFQHHPACQNKANVVAAFLDAIKWIETFETSDESSKFDALGLAGSRVSVSISTNDVGIQFTTDGNGRGAIVYSVRKLSQAALSFAIVPGLSLIAINQEPVIGMPFDSIIQRVRTAALPKQLTFMTEFYYYKLLSLDSEMFQYLMCLACRRGDLDSASWLRSSSVEINRLCSWEKSRGKQVFGFIPVSGKGSPLHAAVHSGHYRMVKYLVSRGADVNLCNQRGRRPLHVVNQSKDMAQIIERLINAGADIDAMETEGLTPLMSMCARASLEGAATLLALGANVHCVAWSNGFSALEYAVKSGRADLVELCLAKEANPNASTLDGDTSLHLAAALAHADIILRLLQSGANPNAHNRYGQTPATVLLASGYDDARIICLEILVCAGCSLNKRDLFGCHVAHLANISQSSHMMGLLRKVGLLNQSGTNDVDMIDCVSLDTCQLNEVVEAQVLNNLWKRTGKHDLVPRPANSRSIEDMVCDLLAGTDVDFVDYVAFVLFLDSFSSLNEVVDRLSDHVRPNIKCNGLLRLFIILLLFRDPEYREANELRDRFTSLISLNADVSITKVEPLVEKCTALYRDYFSLKGSGNYALNYETIPDLMTKMYGLDSSPEPKPFMTHIYRSVDAERWSQQCTLLTHAVFCKIPVQDFFATGSKMKHSLQFTTIKRWFQHLSAYVINAVLIQETPEERAKVISFYLKAAEFCMSLHNYDTLASILYALQSTAVQRLRKTIDCLSVDAKKTMNEMQLLSDKGCREMNRLMRNSANPCMPYLGLYLQAFVGLSELPVFSQEGLVNSNRLRRMGELALEILHHQSVAYTLPNDEKINEMLHVKLPYASEENRYTRSLELEPREVDATPLSDRSSSIVIKESLDLESEVRESIGSDGTFGFRQWIRKQQVVHRNRSRSSMIALYEWV